MYIHTYIYMYIYIYLNIPVIRPGFIYKQRTNLMGLYWVGVICGGLGVLIFLYSGGKTLQFGIC